MVLDALFPLNRHFLDVLVRSSASSSAGGGPVLGGGWTIQFCGPNIDADAEVVAGGVGAGAGAAASKAAHSKRARGRRGHGGALPSRPPQACDKYCCRRPPATDDEI